MAKRAYTDLRPAGWVGHWVNQNLHNDTMHEWSREECEECQRAIEEYGRMPSRRMLLRGYEMLKRPEFKQSIPVALRRAVLERDNHTCQQCNSTQNLTVDHIYPEVWGGLTTLENLQTLCRTCNLRKSDRKPQ